MIIQLKKIILFIAIINCIACESDQPISFTPPTIINSQFPHTTPTKLSKAEYLTGVFPTFIGKYKFRKEIDINREKRDTSIFKDFIDDYSRIKYGDSLDVNGLEIIVDYKETVYYNKYFEYDSTLYSHYPVYFVNSTQSDKIFLGKDGHVFGIQEAQDKSDFDRWRPIESRGYDFCGNGTWGLKVKPNEFVLVLMKKYSGQIESEMRVRFKIGENILVSQPFLGFINEKQFHLEDSSFVSEELQKTHGAASSWLFYGAEIKKEEWSIETKETN